MIPTESLGTDRKVCVKFRGDNTVSWTSVLKFLPVIFSATKDKITKPMSEYVGVVNGGNDGGSLAMPANNCPRSQVGTVPQGGNSDMLRGGNPRVYKVVRLTS